MSKPSRSAVADVDNTIKDVGEMLPGVSLNGGQCNEKKRPLSQSPQKDLKVNAGGVAYSMSGLKKQNSNRSPSKAPQVYSTIILGASLSLTTRVVD
jgi:hypothetical protein